MNPITPGSFYGLPGKTYSNPAGNQRLRDGLAAKFGQDAVNILTQEDGTIDRAHIRELFRVDGVPPAEALVTSRRKSGGFADTLIRIAQESSPALTQFREEMASVGGATLNTGAQMNIFA